MIKMIIKGRRDTYPEPTGLLLIGCLTKSIHQQFQLSLLRSEFQLDWLHRKDGEKDAKTARRKQDCGEIQADGDEPGHFCSYKFFICEQSDCVEKPGDTQSFKSTGWIIRETWCKRESKFWDWNFGRGMLNCS